MDTRSANGSLEYSFGEAACKPQIVEAWAAAEGGLHIVQLVVHPVGHNRLVVAEDTVRVAPDLRH